ncbi:calpain-2 catalytic subunit-like [Spea bombifrons]|uniref:calpain-2 catalytic subunit-like n=1 Tax=Spea bombifrons TaxID=233779 RepID=UPI00234A9107|nr:calpain-2 catalytic subunit-like [Spea bombifrons]
MTPAGITVRLLKDDGLSAPGGDICPYLGQDYQQLLRECLQQRRLFEDPHFPAEPKSLGYNQLGPWSAQTRGIQWKRPQEICQTPSFICKDMECTDVCQGHLGNCWFLAAAASLTVYPLLMQRVVPPQQSFKSEYAGIFHFRFWQYGEWVDVVVDDRLPTMNGELVFVRSEEQSEFWAALLEKAYAKLNGSYEGLSGGWVNEAFVDFTGGLDESFDLQVIPPNLYPLIERALKKRSLMGASINITSQHESEMRTPEGLVKGHAYSIIAATQAEAKGRKVPLLRLRNPWGKVEWSGRWSDSSPLWSSLEPPLRAKLHASAEDGEFWMQMDDFLRFFNNLEICSLTPDSVSGESAQLWNANSFQGRWSRGHSAGGCRNYPATFWTNPQFLVTLKEEDEVGAGVCTLLVSLMQKDGRTGRSAGRDFLIIGFEIYQVPEKFDQETLVSQRRTLIPSLVPVVLSPFVAKRDVTGRFQLPPGQYLVIPSTFYPHEQASFTLRVFTEKQQSLTEIDYEIRADPTVFQESESRNSPEEFDAHFKRLSGQDQEISAPELQRILRQTASKHAHLKNDGFPLEICTQLLNLVNRRGNGSLNQEEFRRLWSKIKEWEHIFCKYDTDGSGSMDVQELRVALEFSGFHLNNQLVASLCRRFGGLLLKVDFDSFLSCQAHLLCIFGKCQALDADRDGVVTIGEGQWLQLTGFQ